LAGFLLTAKCCFLCQRDSHELDRKGNQNYNAMKNIILQEKEYFKMPKQKYDMRLLSALTGGLISALERKHPYTRGHSFRVSTFSVMLAECLEPRPTETEIELIRLGALLHDIGKVCVEAATLNNPGRRLTTDQVVELEDHPYYGLQILRKCGTLIPQTIIDCVFSHHERYDGQHDGNLNGYPLGLSGEAIPLPGRLVAIADNFDAMTSARSYQRKLNRIEAINALQAMAGKKLDPKLVRLFIKKVIPEINARLSAEII